jgi:hypothetical protein
VHAPFWKYTLLITMKFVTISTILAVLVGLLYGQFTTF